MSGAVSFANLDTILIEARVARIKNQSKRRIVGRIRHALHSGRNPPSLYKERGNGSLGIGGLAASAALAANPPYGSVMLDEG
jgi:hypothetical protein